MPQETSQDNKSPNEYSLSSFLGGINQQVDPTRIPDDSYFLGVNIRVRRDAAEPIKLPLDLSTHAPAGNYQGLYSAANFSLLLADGNCYVKDYENDPNGGYVSIPDFQMDANVDTIYAAIIPAANMVLGRKAITAGQATTTVGDAVVLSNTLAGITLNGNEAGILFQDGINQPLFVNSAGQARQTQNYADWTLASREYVPVGKQMLESDGILYVVSSDGLQIYRSVTGRFLDFVVAVDTNGFKAGNAASTSYSVSRNPITAINTISTEDGFFVSTKQVSYIVTPILDTTIFSEPTYKKSFLFETGVGNQVSTVDLNGDTGFIDSIGIRSFNATKQLLIESNNESLSATVSRLFAGITQTTTATIDFEDYAFFACTTVYGSGILVYDKTLGKFISFDMYPGVAAIKQFSAIRTSTGRKLLFITVDNKLYEAFASSETAPAQLYIGEFCSNDPSVEQKILASNLVFVDAIESGTVSATIIVDRKLISTLTKNISKTMDAPTVPSAVPLSQTANDSVQVIGFIFEEDSRRGWKVGVLIEWNCFCYLSHVRVETETNVQKRNSMEQQAKTWFAAMA